MEVLDLGLVEYGKALEIQERVAGELREATRVRSSAKISAPPPNKQEKLICCEHPLVITLGRGLESRSDILDQSAPVFEVNRGGRATLHLPGQAVVYPILNLNSRGRDLHAYLRILELGLIQTLADFRIKACVIPGKTGVWVGQKKIASLGVAVKEWVTTHGIALNVNCDLTQFSKIRPCGFSSDVMTSVIEEMPLRYKQEWVQAMDRLFKDVKGRLLENLKPLLERESLKLSEEETLQMTGPNDVESRD